jgi:protein TonB
VELLKTGVASLLFHMVLIILLIFYMKAGIPKGVSTVYRVAIHPVSSQSGLNPYPLRTLPAPQPIPARTQIQKEPVEPKQPRQLQEDERTIKAPVPLPIAEASPLNADSNIKKFDNLAIHLAPSPEEKNKNAILELSSREVPGTGLRGSTPGGSMGGQEVFSSGGAGEGMAWGSSAWASSGKGTGSGKMGHRGGSGDGGSGVSSPGYVKNPKPVYPPEAREKGYQGEVLLKVEVLSNGRVGDVGVEKSSGCAILDKSALSTVKKWRFIPARKEMVAIPCWVNIPIKFQLQ